MNKILLMNSKNAATKIDNPTFCIEALDNNETPRQKLKR